MGAKFGYYCFFHSIASLATEFTGPIFFSQLSGENIHDSNSIYYIVLPFSLKCCQIVSLKCTLLLYFLFLVKSNLHYFFWGHLFCLIMVLQILIKYCTTTYY